MFADPQSITVNAVAQTLPRVGSPTPEKLGTFRTADNVFTYEIRQNQTAARFRREIRLSKRAIAADPVSASNKEVSASVIIAVDSPKWGFTNTELKQMIDGLTAYFASAKQDQLLQGEL